MPDWKHDFIMRHRVARLATVDSLGQPHVVPIVYAFDGNLLFTPVDAKPKRVAALQLQRVRNLRANPAVAVVIDDYAEDWRQLAWVQIRGAATILSDGETYVLGMQLLSDKYEQYAQLPLDGRPLIAVTPERVRAWRAS